MSPPRASAAGAIAAAALVAIAAAAFAAVASGAPGGVVPMAARAGEAPWTSIFPSRIEGLRRCDQFDATIEVWRASDLAAFQLELAFDEKLMAFESGVVTPWLAARWQSYTTLPPIIGAGNVTFAAAADPGSPAASGNGEIAALRFRALGGGTSLLDLHDVRLVDSAFRSLVVTSTDAVVVIQDEDGPGCAPTPTFTPATPTLPATATPGPSPTATMTPSATETAPPGTPTATDEPGPATASATAASPTATAQTPMPPPGVTPSEAPPTSSPVTGEPPSPSPGAGRLYLPTLSRP